MENVMLSILLINMKSLDLEMLNKNVTKTVLEEWVDLKKIVYDFLKFDKKQYNTLLRSFV